MSKVTFLLPLKDRPEYTKIWLEHNIRPEYSYLVADGSLGDENEALFSDIKLLNLTYIRFPKDSTIDHYVEKMFQAVGRVKTKYVMTCDNDDFINFDGVIACINALEDDSDAICAGGLIYGMTQKESVASDLGYCLPIRLCNADHLDGRSGFDGLGRLFKNYTHMWYAIFRTEDYQQIWRDIKQLKISNVYLVEILQAQLVFCYGKYVQVKYNHYIRLKNPSTSCAREVASMNIPHVYKIYFDDDYRGQVLRMSEHVAKLVGVELASLLNELKNYYVAGVVTETPSFWTKTRARLIRIHEIIPRKLHIFFSIASVIAFVNTLGRVRRTLKS